MSFWFGEPWPRADYRAPICEDDALRVATPVGERCVMCGEEIRDGDRGTVIGVYDPDADGKLVPRRGYMHIECSMRSVMGNMTHLNGNCRHTGDCNQQDQRPYREQAIEVWAHFQSGGSYPEPEGGWRW